MLTAVVKNQEKYRIDDNEAINANGVDEQATTDSLDLS